MELGTIVNLKYEELMLDPDNPRLLEDVSRDQGSMLNYIAESTSIEDLMGAIAENDFFPGEPLVAVEEGGNYVVVEGNRRLAAIMLLHNPSLCNKPSSRMLEISLKAKFKPVEVPVVLRKSREDVLPYLGFRHITGVKQWEPVAKARYIKQLYNIVSGGVAERYTEVARMIGSRRDHIKRSLDALAAYDHIKHHDFYGIPNLDESSIKFAILSTALSDENIGLFVGVSGQDEDGDVVSTDLIENPGAIKSDNLKELTTWLYETTQTGRPRIPESRKLREFSSVVNNPRALAAFRDGASLEIAYRMTSEVGRDFSSMLFQAESLLADAAGLVANVPYSSESYDAAVRLSENIKLIGKALREKRSPEEDPFA